MFKIFKAYVLRRVAVSDDEFALLQQVVKLKNPGKRRYVLQEGEVGKYHCFFVKV